MRLITMTYDIETPLPDIISKLHRVFGGMLNAAYWLQSANGS